MFNQDKRNEKRESEIRKTKEFNKKRKEADFEKGDLWALILAAITTILPIAIITVLVIWFITLAFFRFFG